MWKVCIAVLCALLVCCNNSKNRTGYDKNDDDCIPLLDNILDSVYLNQYKQDNNKHVILGVFFYTIDTSNFLIIGPVPCVQRYSKSYLEYKNYLIDYIGIDDSVARIVLPINKMKTDYPIEGYINFIDCPKIHWDVEAKTYFICGKDSLILYYPDKEHERILWDIMEKTSIIRPLPPVDNDSGL